MRPHFFFRPLSGLGASCDNNAECASGTCYVDTAAQTSVCSQNCSLDDSGSCPDGFSCSEVGFGTPKCLAGGDGGGCGCRAGRRAGLDGGLGAALAGLALVFVLRRRRS